MKTTRPWDGVHHENYFKGNDEVDYCVRCGRRIKQDEDTVGLELNAATGEWAEQNLRTVGGGGSTWGADSQGWFNFGATCARRTMNEQNERKLAEMRKRHKGIA